MQDVVETQRELLRRIQTEGVLVAYKTALDVCRSAKSTSPARATAAATLFRVAGYFSAPTTGAGGKEPHEMTANELASAISNLEMNLQRRDLGIFD